ncbi:class I SAM-dependent methyltransferase [Paenibacillus sp. IITD108]|uniref:class I SAM-dependent methyltransferase n=1 Tax=Paenibacillus sp. IITD108 TaxID=3116649 RepID=UPI002F3EF156
MGFLSVLSTAHKWIAERAGSGDIVIDATAGGGVDTLALAQLVGANGTVYAFDIQQEALDRTAKRLEPFIEQQHITRPKLVLDSHSSMADYIPHIEHGKIAAIMFNLGYLPGGNETVITEPASTIAALQASLQLLRRGGIITCMLYPGHEGGLEEAQAVESWAAALPTDQAQAVIYRQLQRANSPYLIAIERRNA